MTEPNPRPDAQTVPIVAQLIDRVIHEVTRVDYLEAALGPDWRSILGECLFDAWAHGYTEGFADSDNVLKERKQRE